MRKTLHSTGKFTPNGDIEIYHVMFSRWTALSHRENSVKVVEIDDRLMHGSLMAQFDIKKLKFQV